MNDEIWTVRRVLEWIEGYLAQQGDEKPRASAQWLVSEALGVSRMQLFVDGERPLSADERATLRDWTRRRASGEPLQYITGEAAFRHITVKVRPGVLIPRPETEVLVSEALALLPSAPKPQDALDEEILRLYKELGGEAGSVDTPEQEEGGLPYSRSGTSDCPPGSSGCVSETPAVLLVADLCTGSGCIACSIALEHPLTHVVATDISPQAIELARENVSRNGLDDRIDILECDLGSGVDDILLGKFDLVVSNPPYIPTAVLAQLPREVGGYEPPLALDGGEDGLCVYRRLLEFCAKALKPEAAFAFELHETCLDAAAAMAREAGFTDVRIVCDLATRPRVLTARKRNGI